MGNGMGAKPECSCWHVLDGGFGTGHHLARVEAALSLPTIGLGLDIAKDAAHQSRDGGQGLHLPSRICGRSGR